LPSDAQFYNRLTVFHEFYVLDEVSKDKVMTGSTSGVEILLQLSAKRQWCSILLIVLLSHISIPFGEGEENFGKTFQPRLRGNPCQSCQDWIVWERKTVMKMMIVKVYCTIVVQINCKLVPDFFQGVVYSYACPSICNGK